jgi:hypothetical protein
VLECGLVDPYEIISVEQHDHDAMIDIPEQSFVPVARVRLRRYEKCH